MGFLIEKDNIYNIFPCTWNLKKICTKGWFHHVDLIILDWKPCLWQVCIFLDILHLILSAVFGFLKWNFVGFERLFFIMLNIEHPYVAFLWNLSENVQSFKSGLFYSCSHKIPVEEDFYLAWYIFLPWLLQMCFLIPFSSLYFVWQSCCR